MPVPHTVTKLSQSLTLIGIHQTTDQVIPTPDPNQFKPEVTSPILDFGQDLAEFTTSFKQIGAVYGFRIEQRRDNKPRRGLNSAIEPFGMLPGPVTTSVSMSRAVLYLEDAMAAFKFVPGNIAFQTRPLILLELTTLPDIPQFSQRISAKLKLDFDLSLTNPLIYTNCWISDSTMSYDLKGADQMVVQDVTMNVARIVNPISLIPGLGDTGFRELASNFSILSRVTGVKL